MWISKDFPSILQNIHNKGSHKKFRKSINFEKFSKVPWESRFKGTQVYIMYTAISPSKIFKGLAYIHIFSSLPVQGHNFYLSYDGRCPNDFHFVRIYKVRTPHCALPFCNLKYDPPRTFKFQAIIIITWCPFHLYLNNPPTTTVLINKLFPFIPCLQMQQVPPVVIITMQGSICIILNEWMNECNLFVIWSSLNFYYTATGGFYKRYFLFNGYKLCILKIP